MSLGTQCHWAHRYIAHRHQSSRWSAGSWSLERTDKKETKAFRTSWNLNCYNSSSYGKAWMLYLPFSNQLLWPHSKTLTYSIMRSDVQGTGKNWTQLPSEIFRTAVEINQVLYSRPEKWTRKQNNYCAEKYSVILMQWPGQECLGDIFMPYATTHH